MKVEKISKNNDQENTTNTVTTVTDAQLTAINNQIQTIYNMDVESIRNLGAISKSLLTGTNYHSTTVGTPGELTIPADKLIMNGSLSFLPIGSVIMWAFAKEAIPPGWVYCDGTNNTPDFRDRMPIGGAWSHPVKQVGGGGSEGGNKSKATTLITIPSANHLPPHNHAVYSGGDAHWSAGSIPGGGGGGYVNWSSSVGQGWGWNQVSYPIDIQPYYTSIIFIMRVI